MTRKTAAAKRVEQENKVVNFQVVNIKMVKEAKVDYGMLTDQIFSIDDAQRIAARVLEEADREHLIVLVLNTKNRVVAINTAHVGTLDMALGHPREIFKAAILANGSSIILAHNHPSGDPTPSQADIEMTKRIMQAGEIMGISLLDHIIIGDGRHSSLKQLGHM